MKPTMSSPAVISHTAEDKEKMEEANLFLTMAELKARDGTLAPARRLVVVASCVSAQIEPRCRFISELFLYSCS